MPRVPNYVRLRGSESEDQDMLGGFFKDAGVLTEQQEGEEANSDCHDGFAAAQKYQNPLFEQQLKQVEDVNDSKTFGFRRSLSHRNLSSMDGSKDVMEATRMAKSGELKRLASSWDNGETPELAMSPSGRWQVLVAAAGGRGNAQLERKKSGKWKASENDQFIRAGSPLRELFAPPNRQTAAGGKRAASSIQRIVSIHKNREIPVQPSRLSANERDNFSPARRAWFAEDVNGKSSPPRRLQRQQTARFTDWEKVATEGREHEHDEEEEEEKPSPPRKLQRQQTGRFADRGEKPISVQNEDQHHGQNTESSKVPEKSPSKKIVDSQRSFSMRETSSCVMDIDGLLEDAPRRKSSAGAGGKARVSFSNVVSSTIPDRESAAEAQRVDSPSSTAIRFQARLLSAATRSQPLRYNYEQPGFVERKSTDGAYGTGGGAGGGNFSRRKEEKENIQQPPLSRTLSTFTSSDKATYRRVASALPLSTPSKKTQQPVVIQCVSCGKGLGIVVQGFSAGEASSFCKACKPAGGPGTWDKSTNRSSSVKSFSKKKSMLSYCRKLLGLSKTYNNNK